LLTLIRDQVRRQGAFSASAVLPSAAVCARLLVEFSLPRAWFSSLYASAVYFLIDERDLLPNIPAMQTRGRIILRYLAVITFTTYILWQLRQPFHDDRDIRYTHAHAGKHLAVTSPPQAFDPLQLSNTQVHPIAQLAHNAETTWKRTLQSQSHTIEQAVTEYRRRYGIPPPPNFDKWFDFARHRGVQLIDEYDSIYHSLLPFWGLKPATIRGRAREVLGFENNAIMGLLVRDGKVVHVEEGSEWFQQAIVGMMEDFVQHLPDMDIVLNLSDEPRVVIPHDELERLIKRAHQGDIAESSYNPYPKNEFGPRPADMSNGKRIAEVKTTRFNQFAHQPTWIPSRMSCPLDSPARALDDLNAHDNLTAYALSELGFIYNQTAFSDICNSPSFATSHGFFDRPNAFSVVHDLFPIFSQSKMSSYQDITYPSPWYWFGKVTYTLSSDPEWEEKEDKLWWRGSTTGGFSRAGGWKRQHRQQVIRKLNALDDAKILQKQTSPRAENAQQNDKDRSFSSNPAWSTVATPRASYPSKLDAYFSSVGQCDAGDCDAQREFFHIAPAAEQQEAWRSKYLLDLDGNAFSGRFYAFLKSRSLVFKMAVFREWHSDSWLIPWVHYVPLSLRGEESLEALRYLDKDDEGRALARKMSRESTKWAEAALRKEDFEVWLFRLLLEYGRVLNDDRAQLGYGPTARTATGSHDDAEPERH
jgi:hypothetical protein